MKSSLWVKMASTGWWQARWWKWLDLGHLWKIELVELSGGIKGWERKRGASRVPRFLAQATREMKLSLIETVKFTGG